MWRDDAPGFHVTAFIHGPPFFGVKTIAFEEHAQSLGRFAGLVPRLRWVAPDAGRFHQRQALGYAGTLV
ncbi:MAG: hypothetical protein CMO80_08820 [Verrucomicrobiales bacterium]|nr:hypothetical protein [Verrucomicrobiales bacterium]|tara:strand:+ start:610 stop:816 length:207 start_codon:yes stop_codon:yes gene_type:complete